jgi:two-component sensor histidine kinase/CHASE1-domain containing sensor protein
MNKIARYAWLFILLAGLAFATVTYFGTERDEADQANRLATLVSARVKDQLDVLDGTRALFTSNNDATPDDRQIRRYLQQLETDGHEFGIEGIGLVLVTRPDNVDAIESRIASNYGIKANVWPAMQQDLGFTVVMIEPDNAANRRALGYNMYSEAVRRRAIQKGWATRKVTVSGLVKLVQDRDASSLSNGFIIYMPLIDTRTARSHQQIDVEHPIQGFVYAPVRIKDMFDAVLGPHLPGIDGISVYAGPNERHPLVYQRGQSSRDAHATPIRIADTQWTMVISYDRPLNRYGWPISILIGTFALAFSVAQFARVQRRRIAALKALAEEKARNAEDRELMLGEMAHRLKNGFARIGALARITSRESKDLKDFEGLFEGRLRALSDTKQMMVHGAASEMDLQKLIHNELELAGYPRDMRSAISGPTVILDEEGAQAISLVVHELVTNSVKYGALSGTGRLSVQWKRAGHMIELIWLESDLSVTPVLEKESFGTQFIRTLIERQLHGKWLRESADHQLNVYIRWQESPSPT